MKPTRVRYGVGALAIGLAVLAYMQRVAISMAAGPISRDLHIGPAQMGLIFGAFGLSYALFELPMGMLGDRLGVRRVLTQIVIAWSSFTALTGAAWNGTSLWVINFLFGAGEAGCFPNLTRMLSSWLPPKERVRSQSLLWASTRWGGAATPPLVLLGITLFGWRWTFVALAMLGIVWALIFRLWFRDNPADHPRVNAAEREMLVAPHASVTKKEGQPGWLSLVLTWRVAVLVLQYFCYSYVWYFYITWLPTYLRQDRGQSPAHTATLAMLPLLFGGFGSIASGLIPARIPRRIIAFFGYAGTAILVFAFIRITAVVPAMICLGFASFFGDLTMPISWDACFMIGGSFTATVAATMNMMGNLAGFVAPVVGGIILQQTGGKWNPLLYTMVAAASVSALCWLFLDFEKGGRQSARGVGDTPAAIGANGVSS